MTDFGFGVLCGAMGAFAFIAAVRWVASVLRDDQFEQTYEEYLKNRKDDLE